MLAVDVARHEAESLRGLATVEPAADGRDRMAHPVELAFAAALDGDRRPARWQVQHDTLRPGTGHLGAQHVRRTQHRMPGKRQFALGREDPDRPGPRDRRRRGNERGFREVHLAGERLHLPGRQAGGSQHHGKRVAGARLVGKHVDDVELALHG